MEEFAVNGVGTMLDDDIPEGSAETSQPLTHLSALDALFVATGTVQVKVGQRTIALPIQSVDTELLEAFVKPYRPVPPTRSELQNGRRVVVENQADKAYQDKLAEYNRIWLYAVAFHGLALDITDAQGRVVWSADNTTRDLPATRGAIKKMGMVDNHLSAIVVAINELTKFAEETQGRD